MYFDKIEVIYINSIADWIDEFNFLQIKSIQN